MNNFTPKTNPEWVNVPQLEQNMPVLGGEGHPSNWQARALTERTDYLYKILQSIVVPEPPTDGVNGLSVISSNESALILADQDGVVTSYAFSGCTLQVLEGATPLLYDGLGNSPGRWKVTAVGTNITPGAITPTSVGVTVADHTGMPQLASSAMVQYTLEGQSLGGIPFVLPKLQTFIKVSSTEGNNGMSAYEMAVLAGFSGTYTEWLASLKGTNGTNGESAYDLAVLAGFVGTYEEWLDSLKGTNGKDGTRAYSRAITGSVWSDLEAIQAYRDWGVDDPVIPTLGDTVTLFNVSLKFSEMREYTSTGWVKVVSRIPGSAIMAQSITTEQLLVTGMGASISPDPNTQDISAWLGTDISLVADPSAPNGISALRITGEQSVVLSRPFPIDRSLNYRLRTWVRGQGTGTAYLIVSFLDANGNTLQGSTHKQGWPSSLLYHSYGLVYDEVPTVWTEYAASFGPDEDYGIPVGAKSMQIGMYANMDGPGVQYFSGMTVRQKTDGSLIVDGSVRARHIISNGLIIHNELGEVVLDASGNNIPPWVVDVLGSSESGSLSLVKPRDNSNRAAIRSIIPDNKTISAKITGSGNSIALSAKNTNFLNNVYKDPLAILITDGLSRIDHSYINLEANKTYRIGGTFVTKAAASGGNAVIYFKAPADSLVSVNGAEPYTIPNTLEQNLVSGATSTSINTISGSILITVGNTGGAFNMYATATDQNFDLVRGTTIYATEISQYLTPISDVVNVPAMAIVPFSEAPYVNSAYMTATPEEAYKAHLNLTFDMLGGLSSTNSISRYLRGFSGPQLVLDEVNSALLISQGFFIQESENAMIVVTYDFAGMGHYIQQNGYGAGFKAAWIKDYAPSERLRWSFKIKTEIIDSYKFSPIWSGIPTGEHDIDFTDVDAPNIQYDSFSEGLVYSVNQTIPHTPAYVVLEYTFTAYRLGVLMSTWKYRVTLNFV